MRPVVDSVLDTPEVVEVVLATVVVEERVVVEESSIGELGR